MEKACELLERFDQYIITPAIFLIFTFGFFLFVWGLVQFIWNLDEGASHQEGIRHMTWGIVGMFVMVSVWGIIQLLSATFSLGIGGPSCGSYNPDTSRIKLLESFKFK